MRSPNPLSIDESQLTPEASAAVKEFMKKRVGSSITIGQLPTVVPRDAEEGTTLFAMRQARRDLIDIELQYIMDNINKPAFRNYLSEQMNTIKWRRALNRKITFGDRENPMSAAERQQDLQRHIEQRRKVMNIRSAVMQR